jgi:hypothetical protein
MWPRGFLRMAIPIKDCALWSYQEMSIGTHPGVAKQHAVAFFDRCVERESK